MNEFELLKWIPSIVKEYGTVTVSFIIILFFVIYYGRKFLDIRLENYKNKMSVDLEKYRKNITMEIEKEKKDKRDQNIFVDKIKNHSFFIRLDHKITVELPCLPIREEFRRAVFTDMLIIKFKTVKEKLLKLDYIDIEELNRTQFLRLILDLLSEIINSYESKYVEKDIPLIVINKFNDWHKERIQTITKMLEEIALSEFYLTNMSKVIAMLTVYELVLHQTILDAERTLASLNGELEGLKYKNIICGEQRRR